MKHSTSLYWADNYVEKRTTAEKAIAQIRPGHRVYIGAACGEPQELVRALSKASTRLSGVEIVRMMSQETTSLTDIANRMEEDVFQRAQQLYSKYRAEYASSP